MKVFADELGHKGPIKGCDLGKTKIDKTDSAYIQYTVEDGVCTIECQQWSEVGKETGSNTRRLHHKKILGTQELATIVIAVNTTALTSIIPDLKGTSRLEDCRHAIFKT